MDKPLRVLIIDDSVADTLLLVRALRKGGLLLESERVDTADAMCQALANGWWDVAISDCHMPEFSPEEALGAWLASGNDQPFIVVSGAIGEEEAVALLKAGAHDFVRKDNFSRLVPAIDRELREAEGRKKHRLAEKELRESEEKYRQLFSAESAALVILDAQTRMVMEVNTAAAKLFGYSLEEFTDLSVEAITAEPEMAQPYVEGILEGGISSVPLITLKRKDGTSFPAEISAGPFMWKDHRMFVVIIRDVSERQKIDRMKDEMLSAVSHEMRTPLTVIMGFVEFMLDSDVNTELQREYHETIAKETRRLKDMIDNLLTLQQLRAGYGRENFQSVPIYPLLYQMINLFYDSSGKLRFVIDCPSDLPPVRGHEENLQQAVGNLLSNAIKYAPNGGTVTLGARIENGFVVLSVEDEGRGIPADDLDEIFDRFFRIDSSNNQRMGATGLGLPLVKEIAKAHGGRVWVESSLGEGSTFFLTIPLDAADKES